MENSLILLIGFITYSIASIAGFGDGVVGVTLLTNILPINQITPLIAIFGFLMYLSLLPKHFEAKKVNIKLISFLTVGSILGSFIGIFVLNKIDNSTLVVFVGFLVIFYVLSKPFLPKIKTKPKSTSAILSFLAGFVSGVLSVSTGINSQSIVIYLTSITQNKKWLSLHLILFFTINSFLQVFIFGIHGFLNKETLENVLIFAPGAVFGIILGKFLYNFIPQKSFNFILMGLLFASGLFLIFG